MALILPSRTAPVVPTGAPGTAPKVAYMTTATVTGYDVTSVRSRYPALADGWAYLDGAAGTQVPRAVIEAESAAYAAGIGNHGGGLAASRPPGAPTTAAPSGVAGPLGAPPPPGGGVGPPSPAPTHPRAPALARARR